MPPLITSFANPTVKRFRSLAARKNRRAEQAFTVEGLQPVWYAVESAWQLDTIVVAPDLLRHEPSWQMVDEAERDGTGVVWVARDVFEHLSTRDGPSGLAAIVRGTIGGLDSFTPHPDGPVIALFEPANPGNIGTVIRSADAAGAAGVLVVGSAADPLAPSSVKAAMGSLFALPVAATAQMGEVLSWADETGRPLAAITGNTSASLWDAKLTGREVLLFGSEREGLPQPVAEQCQQQLAIPMQGSAESLNLATAVSVTVFEMARRRGREVE